VPVCQKRLKVLPVDVQVFQGGDADTIEDDAPLTEEELQEVVCHGHVVGEIDVRTVGSDELHPNHYVNTEIDVRLTDTRYDISDVRLIHEGL
jgi:hypothetical protein